MAEVFSVMAASAAFGSIVNVSISISTNTGVAPQRATALAVAANVKEGMITSSPHSIPDASKPRCKAEVPEFTAMQW